VLRVDSTRPAKTTSSPSAKPSGQLVASGSQVTVILVIRPFGPSSSAVSNPTTTPLKDIREGIICYDAKRNAIGGSATCDAYAGPGI
jgi:hypothetical protein